MLYTYEAITTIKVLAYLSFPRLYLFSFVVPFFPHQSQGTMELLFVVEISLHLLGFYISGIIYCVVCVCICVCVMVFFHSAWLFEMICTYRSLLLPSGIPLYGCAPQLVYTPTDRQLGCCHFGPVTNKAAVDI